MDYEELVVEMTAIGAQKLTPQNSLYFGVQGLSEESIGLGCRRILSWLRALSISMRIRPFRLKRNDPGDEACIELISRSEVLQEVFSESDHLLDFSPQVTADSRRKIVKLAKAKEVGILLWDPYIDKPEST